LAEPDTDFRAYVASLHASGAAALLVELGRHVSELPEGLVQAARAHRFPLVELQAPVRFVEITGTVHARVVNEQYERLSLAQRAHQVLGPLGIEGASTDEILGRCVDLTGRPVVLEDLAHRVLAFGGDTAEEVLRDWPARSRQVPSGEGTSRGGPEQWLSIPVGPRRRRWGRLVVPTRVSDAAAPDVQLVLERAAEAVTIAHLVSSPGEGLAGAAAARLLQDVLTGQVADDVALRARARALGFTPGGGIAVVVARGTGDATGPDTQLVSEVSEAAQAMQRSALVGRLRPQLVAVLFDCPSEEAGTRLPEELAGRLPGAVVAAVVAGPTAQGWRNLAPSLVDAEHVASVAAPVSGTDHPAVIRSGDLGIRGLLWQIRDDARLHSFIESRLGPLLALPAGRRERALATLESYLASNGVMASFARALHLSRATAYERLRSLELKLGTDLADAEERTGLHLALIAYGLGR
ncbi:helix-turn-helix domain-containing protein, partial [Prauserella cavernicola]